MGHFGWRRPFAHCWRESKGRITNIGSISGILAGARLNAYSISKHGIEAFTDSLAAELAPQGVIVNVVEPGNFNSAIGASAAKRTGVTTTFTDRTKYKEPDEVSGGDHAGAVRGAAEAPLHGHAGSERSGSHDPQADSSSSRSSTRTTRTAIRATTW